jgi:hypothetical protein
MTRRSSVLLVLLICLTSGARAGDDLYRLNVVGGVGYNFYIATTPDYPGTSGGFSGMVRVMWKPEHRLSAGLETGYIYMYTVDQSNLATEFGPTDIFGARSAVPILIVFTMDIIDRFQVTVGSGQMLVVGTTESFGSRVQSTSLSTAFLGAASYTWPLSRVLELGGEVKWYHASKFEDSGISLQVIGRWTFFEW